jgi:phosphate-selective porin OprO/OprP
MWTFRKLYVVGVAFAFTMLALATGNPPAQAADSKTTTGTTPPPGANTIPLGFAGWDNGFFIRSPDGAFMLRIGGYAHLDGRFFPSEDKDLNDDGNDSEENKDQFVLRRARPLIEGTVYKYVGFRIMPDFGEGRTVLQDAWADIKYWPQTALRGGKFKAPFGIERLRSATALNFVERGLPDNLVPNRDLGFELHNSPDQVWNYSLAVLNGVVDGGSTDADLGDQKDFAARVFVQPWFNDDNPTLKGFGAGLAATYGNENGNQTSPNLGSYRTPGRSTFFRYAGANATTGALATEAGGVRYRLSPQAYWFSGPLGIMTEYVLATQEVRRGAGAARTRANIDNQAWQINVSYVLTGEANSYKGIKVGRPLNVEQNTWGAWEVSARYGALYIDDDAFDGNYATKNQAASQADALGLAVAWHLNNNLKVLTNYEWTRFEDGAGNSSTTFRDRDDEHIIFMRLQFVI